MRSFKHWTPRYLFNRVEEIIYRLAHPGYPWLTPEANRILSSRIKKSSAGLEFGSGFSTLWLAARADRLTSVEHEPLWYARISDRLRQKNIFHVKYLLFKEGTGQDTHYVKAADRFSEDSLDFVLVDGIHRPACCLVACGKLKAGGMLILDNANWFLPSDSISPNSRAFIDGPASCEWEAVLVALKGWECIWTTNGVSDTTFYIKPQR